MLTGELLLQFLGLIVTIIGIILILYQIKRSRKDSMTSSFISSLSERKVMLEERRKEMKDFELDGYYRFLIPGFIKLLESSYNNDIEALANDFIFNSYDIEVNKSEIKKDKILKVIAKEYLDIDALYGLFEEQYIVYNNLGLVNRKLWEYWEFQIKVTFSSKKMRNYWTLWTNYNTIYPPFFNYIERYLANPPDYDTLIYEEYV